MRIVHFGLSGNPGGVENTLLRVTRAIDRDRYAFSFIDVHSGRTKFRDELTSLGCTFHDMPSRRESVRRNHQGLARLFADHHFDILHMHLQTLSYVAPVRHALDAGVRVILHSRSSNAPASLFTRAAHKVHQRLLPWSRIDRLAVSQQAGRWLFGANQSFSVINNGVDLASFSYRPQARARIRGRLNLSGAFVIGHVGSLLPVKNHEFLLDVFESVVTSVPSAVLVLVGDGPMRANLTDSVRTRGLESRVRMVGSRNDVPDLLSAFDCLVFPSHYEGFANAVVEAQACGLPSVVSEAVSPEAVFSQTCLRMSLDDGAIHWADRVVKFSRDDRNRAADAEVARRGAFSMTDEARALERFYDQITSTT